MTFWTGKRVLVTGGDGFLGRSVVKRLQSADAFVSVPRSVDYDLFRLYKVRGLYADTRPDIVIHLAARCGGIGANLATPGVFFYENLMMGAQMMEEGRRFGIQKFVAIGTVCSYPKNTPVPFREDDLWNGYPEETNAPYGLAKKMLLVQAQAYRQQYGFNAIYLLPANLYGPGDNFNAETSHVIPAMIRKFCEAVRDGRNEVVLWGTGKPTRDFLYVDDAAEAIILAAELYGGPEPVNIGSGAEIKIEDLAKTIARLTGFTRQTFWDRSRPDGQPRRRLSTDRAERLFGFRAHTSLEVGLRKTVDAYMAQSLASA